MGDEAGAGVGLEHAVAEGELGGEAPVGLDLAAGHVGVGQGGGAGAGFGEAVHGTVVPLLPPDGIWLVTEVSGITEGDGLEGDGFVCPL